MGAAELSSKSAEVPKNVLAETEEGWWPPDQLRQMNYVFLLYIVNPVKA